MLQQYKKEALWTQRHISYEAPMSHHETISHMIEHFESRYSRFLSDSLLSQLNTHKIITWDQEFLDLIHIWQQAYSQTWWVFSPFVWSSLESLWYDAEYSFRPTGSTIPQDIISIQEDQITLWDQTHIDIWGYGKGYLIDKISEYFTSQHTQNRIINWWWDIRFSWEDKDLAKPLGIPHPTDHTLLIAERHTSSGAIATSSSSLRKRWEHHHLIDPKTGSSTTNNILSLSVFASTACLADIWATALYIWGEEQLEVLSRKLWVQYLAVLENNTVLYSGGIEWLEVYVG